eukprot:Gb_04817 [translate_table: standard]
MKYSTSWLMCQLASRSIDAMLGVVLVVCPQHYFCPLQDLMQLLLHTRPSALSKSTWRVLCINSNNSSISLSTQAKGNLQTMQLHHWPPSRIKVDFIPQSEVLGPPNQDLDESVVCQAHSNEQTELSFGRTEEAPRIGHWNFNNKIIIRVVEIKGWTLVNFSPRFSTTKEKCTHELQQCCNKREMVMSACGRVLKEPLHGRNLNPIGREERMLEQMKVELPYSNKEETCGAYARELIAQSVVAIQ